MTDPGNGERRERERKMEARLGEHDWHLKSLNGSIDRVCKLLEKIEEGQDALKLEVATQRTKLGFYAAIGSLVGGGAITLVFAVATRAGGG